MKVKILILSSLIIFVLVSSGCTKTENTPENKYINAQTQDNAIFEKYSEPDTYPKIADYNLTERTRIVEDSFFFQNTKQTLKIEVEENVYRGAKSTTDKHIYSDKNNPEIEINYYLAFINDPKQNSFYEEILYGLRELKNKLKLTNQEYLDMIVAFVQSTEYDNEKVNDTSSQVQFPIETFVENKGVCIDASLFMAGLLSRENYNVSIFDFKDENHAAVGISCQQLYSYKGTGYCYIETTGYSFIGVVPEQLVGNITLYSYPKIIPIGDGYKKYELANESHLIETCRDTARENMKTLNEKYFDVTDPDAANAQEWNTKVEEYNANLYIYGKTTGSQNDRKGSVEYILKYAKGICL